MKIKTREDLIRRYIEFFKSKNHKEIPSASLIPENDSGVLFTTAGMHPLVPFLLGEKHPLGKRLVSVQKCLRTQDIEEVGDEVHHTFFEMLGNWSLGDYWKKEAIEFSYEFLTSKDWLGIEKEKLAVSCFEGDESVERDLESAEVWKKLGISKDRIVFQGREKNWWIAGEAGPCGPDTEMFFYVGEKTPKKFDPSDNKWVEIWNDVFMQYEKTKDGKYVLLKQKNVDTGMGVERTLAVLNGLNDNYLSSVFLPIIKEIEKISGKKYSEDKKAFRIIADHIRAATFILGDEKGIKPSNVGQGYVLRRLIRRAVRYEKKLGIDEKFTKKIAEVVISEYENDYKELKRNKDFIFSQLEDEVARFSLTLEKGLKKFDEIAKFSKEIISGKDAFLLFQSYGFPIEMTSELAKEKKLRVDTKGFDLEYRKHQELSRTASAGTFKSGLADDSEQTTKLHTATHLLNEALRRVLGQEIRQKGSNINSERLRFDFNFPRKLTEEEIKKIEELVNKKISENLEVKKEEMPLSDALKSGAQAEFGAKYPERVFVYTIIDKKDAKGWFSKEICTGPHVLSTGQIGKFKIIKEESVAAGIRRIKAVVEN